jgi:hypothetical protein
MAPPIKGAYTGGAFVPSVGAGVWGTGINDVHRYYGSPPARLAEVNTREGDITPPWEGVPGELIANDKGWGYSEDEIANEGQQYFVRDDRPGWDVETPENPSRYSTDGQPPLNATGAAKTRFRATMNGAFSKFRGKLPRASYQIPSETVSEGWVNKPQGRPANAVVSDPSQYIMQTSMTQRYRARNNDLAVLRSTDEARSHINSRVTGQRLKVYSQGDRDYDMFPYQQDAEIERPFYYRTAGTGIQDQMEPNAMWSISAVERTPPPDPYIGTQDTAIEYGYTPEDNFYA